MRDDLDALRAELTAAEAIAPAALTQGMDAAVAEVCDVVSRTAVFGVAQAGWTFAHDARHAAFTSLLRVCADVDARWTPRVLAAQSLVDGEAAGGMPDPERVDMLLRAEALVATRPIAPLPPLADLRAHVADAVAAFTARRDDFAAIADTPRTTVGGLLDDVQALLPVAEFDPQEPELDHGIALRFVQDAARVAATLLAEVDARLASSQALLDEHDATAAPVARLDLLTRAAQALLGEDAVLIGRFTLPGDHASEPPTRRRTVATAPCSATSRRPGSTSRSTRGSTGWRACASRCAPGSRRSCSPAPRAPRARARRAAAAVRRRRPLARARPAGGAEPGRRAAALHGPLRGAVRACRAAVRAAARRAGRRPSRPTP